MMNFETFCVDDDAVSNLRGGYKNDVVVFFHRMR